MFAYVVRPEPDFRFLADALGGQLQQGFAQIDAGGQLGPQLHTLRCGGTGGGTGGGAGGAGGAGLWSGFPLQDAVQLFDLELFEAEEVDDGEQGADERQQQDEIESLVEGAIFRHQPTLGLDFGSQPLWTKVDFFVKN